MARRYIGGAHIYIMYYPSCGDYRGSIVVPQDDGAPVVWKFREIYAPKCGLGHGIAYDSPEAYDRMAQAAVSFGSYFTTMNRDEDDDLKGYPSGEVADIINDAVGIVSSDDGTYEVRRSK
jgi:hypothetical protein